jgi:hypothetical protein
MSWEKVGEIGVDAGLCWVGDPCYCVTPDCTSHPAKTWGEFCKKIKARDCDRGFKQWDSGVSVSSGYGDGEYPVYIKRNDDGLIAEVKVVFIPEECNCNGNSECQKCVQEDVLGL